MTRARLSVTVPDGAWKGDVSRRYPETTIRVCATVLGEEAGVELVSVSGPDIADCLSAIEARPDVTDVLLLDRTDAEVMIKVLSATSPILRAGRESGVPIETPFDVTNGEATVEVTSTRDGLSSFGEQLRTLDFDFEVESVQSNSEESQLLTPKQRELLVAAVERGYYETPRRCTLTELADDVDLAKSTCSETLQRAEEVVVEYFLRNAHLPNHAASGPGSTTMTTS